MVPVTACVLFLPLQDLRIKQWSWRVFFDITEIRETDDTKT